MVFVIVFIDFNMDLSTFWKWLISFRRMFSHYYYWEKIQSFLSNQIKTNYLIRLVKITFIYQNASLIVQEISWKLEQVLQGTHSKFLPQSQIGHLMTLTKMLYLHTKLPLSKSFTWTIQFRFARKGLFLKALIEAALCAKNIRCYNINHKFEKGVKLHLKYIPSFNISL